MTSKRTNVAVWHEKYHRWQIKVQKDGVRKTFYSMQPGRTGQRECHKKADEWLDYNITHQQTKIKNILQDYLYYIKETSSKTNYTKIESVSRIWIIPNIGNLKISNLNEQHIQTIINKAYKKGLAKKSLQNIRSIALKFIKYCRKSKMTNLFPEDITIPAGAKKAQKRILQPADMAILFSSDKTTLYRKEVEDKFIHAYRLQVLTGLRPGELLGLYKTDIRDGFLFVQRSKNSLNEITTGKNENAIRHIALNNLAKIELNAQLEKNIEGKYLFGDISLSTYENRWRSYCSHNHINYVSLYELRHTFVSVVKNLPEGQVKQLVGHSKNMDTFGWYGHEIVGENIVIAEQINTLFSDILKQENKVGYKVGYTR